jgi:hypothetical protein
MGRESGSAEASWEKKKGFSGGKDSQVGDSSFILLGILEASQSSALSPGSRQRLLVRNNEAIMSLPLSVLILCKFSSSREEKAGCGSSSVTC